MGRNLILHMSSNKRKKLKFDDRLESKAYRTQNKRQHKNHRHQTKTMLNNYTGCPIDEEEYFDIMGELNDPEME